MLRGILFSIALAGIPLVPGTQAEEVPANFVWCDCICGNYSPLDFECVLSVPNRKTSDYLSKIAPL
jgi:hypothetical protein